METFGGIYKHSTFCFLQIPPFLANLDSKKFYNNDHWIEPAYNFYIRLNNLFFFIRDECFLLHLMEPNYSIKSSFFGGGHSSEAAFALLTQQPRLRFSTFTRVFLDVAEINRRNLECGMLENVDQTI